MREVHHNLFVGSAADLALTDGEWRIVHAAKEPWHRQAVGYAPGKAAPKGPQYLFSQRGRNLSLNLIDAPDPKYIPDGVMDEGCRYISEHIASSKVLVHCNQGQSRAPGLAFYWLWRNGNLPAKYPLALATFRALYPEFNPAPGISGFLEARCKAEPQEDDLRNPVGDNLSDSEFEARFG